MVYEKLHEGVQCAECNKVIKDEDEGESTYCGSMHSVCREDHNSHCGCCREDY